MVKEFDMTNDGWPVALPRLSRRPSDSTMTFLPGLPSSPGKIHWWTCGLISSLTMPGILARPAMLISLSK